MHIKSESPEVDEENWGFLAISNDKVLFFELKYPLKSAIRVFKLFPEKKCLYEKLF